MAVAHVATGTYVRQTSALTSITIASPAGSVGDLLLAFLWHDDHSDGAFSQDGAEGLTWVAVDDGSQQTGDDF